MEENDADRAVQVDPQNPTLDNSPKVSGQVGAGKRDDEFAGHASCKWNGNEYSDGGVVCDAHVKYKCWNGKWVEIGNC